MPPLNLLIKPVSSLCNMRCRYCFYCDVADNRAVASYGRMTDETIERLIQRAFEFAEGSCGFAFQGGEPTLAGADFYRKFVSLVERYNEKRVRVSYAVQTNGYDVSNELCEIFAKYKFLAGISLDGTSALHDANRIDAQGEGTFRRVNDAIRKFERYGIDYNILCVVTENVAKNIGKVYNYFRSRKFGYIQFIKHIDGFGDESSPSVYSLSPKRYASFLKTAFGYYYEDFMKGEYRSVRQFDNFVMLAMGKRPECCGMNGVCPNNMIVEADGGAYPCDFYVIDPWRMGNIHTSSLRELFDSPVAQTFIAQSRSVDEKCKTCRYWGLCRGGCRRYREPFGENGLRLNKYCESYLEFFDYAAPLIRNMVIRLRQKQEGILL